MHDHEPTLNPETEWQAARLIYPLYGALARGCGIDVLPCDELENDANASEQSLTCARDWFAKMDGLIEVHQLRHFLQTTNHAGTDALQALLLHHLRKPSRNDSDRNKVDFLLVQFFSLSVPTQTADADIDLDYVARTMRPVLGQFDSTTPEWLEPLNDLTRKSETCRTLKELFTSRLIEQGRKLKESGGENYFAPIAMANFTRYGFLLRRAFFRLMHQDLNAILDGLRELESRGIEGLDCRRAQFSAYEPMLRLRMICQSWKVMFHAEYSAGQPLCLLVDLRTVVDAALVKSKSQSKPAEAEPEAEAQWSDVRPRPSTLATAAAAGASSSTRGESMNSETSGEEN